jgi:Flp pilus assembly pilin Flp
MRADRQTASGERHRAPLPAGTSRRPGADGSPAAPSPRRQVAEPTDRGAVATEYAILAAFIAVAIGVSIGFFGQELAAYYEAILRAIRGFLP